MTSEENKPIESESTPQDGAAPPNNLLRRLYAWVMSWAERPGGTVALAALGVAESSIFPIPPDPLLMALCLGKPERSYRFALILSVASVVGGMIGYGIGMYFWETWGGWFMSHVPGVTSDGFDHIAELYDTYNFWAVFAAGFTPIPYKLFTIAAGVFQISFPIFVFASIVSRSARFFLVAFLLKRYGKPIKRFIDHYLGWLTLGFAVLLIGGFVLLR